MNCNMMERGAPPAPGAEPVPGIRLVRRIGVGGSGEVWRAEGAGGFPIAVKIVPLSGPRSAAHLRGVDIARAVRHPNLLAGFGAWIDDERLILAMELADGSLWDRFLDARAHGLLGIPRVELIDALAQAARAVDYLNDPRHVSGSRGGLGIQHRDLKPQNILLVGGGVKVADLGAARWMEEDVTGHTGTQWTPAYAAPEFFLGATSRHSDQYSLAVTYCHLRAGRLPFAGEPGYVMAGHLMREPDLSTLDEPERPIVARALAKRPEDRWPSCRVLVESLRAAIPPAAPALPPSRAIAKACLVWPERIVASLAEAAPAVTYATADAAPADLADDSVWDDAPPSGFDTVDGPGPFCHDDDLVPDLAGPIRRRREGIAVAAFVLMGGLALGSSGLLHPSPPQLAPKPPTSAIVRAVPPPSSSPSGLAPVVRRTVARVVLPLIVNPTVPRQFETAIAARGAAPTAGSVEKPPGVEALAEPPPSIRREEAAAGTPAVGR
jgi:serine/threonine protein kinase